jgi:phosphoribosylanthranilate isomerase
MSKSLKIKVCGMREPENIRQLVKLKPDYIGFILFPGSKRYVGDNYILEADIPKRIQRVGVFVNAVIRDVVHWKNRLELDLVQLHGSEPPEYCQEMHDIGLKIIKSFGIDKNFDFSALDGFEHSCDYFLFDTHSPLYGGTGQKFDWSVLQNYSLDKPVFLSGGIGPNDVPSLKDSSLNKLFAIDINSRFEVSSGFKDINLLSEFLTKVRS